MKVQSQKKQSRNIERQSVGKNSAGKNSVDSHERYPTYTSLSRPGRSRWLAPGLLCACLIAIALGEWSGWPFLAAPLEQQLSRQLQRTVHLRQDRAQTNATLHEGGVFRIRFLGGINITTTQLEIAAPQWSASPLTIQAREVQLDLRYRDLWHFYRGQPLRIERLEANRLDAWLERDSQGRASWQFNTSRSASPVLPRFGILQVTEGALHYRDVPLETQLEAQLSLSTSDTASAGALHVHATGTYRKQPLKIELLSTGNLPWIADDANEASTANAPVASGTTHPAAIPFKLDASVGSARLRFNGRARDVLHLSDLSGHFRLQGPSLAAIGEPLGVSLPSTYPFRSEGRLVKQGPLWYVVIDEATVGASQINGAFSYDLGRPVPLLSGRLGGARLLLLDLGPTVGQVPLATSRRKLEETTKTDQLKVTTAQADIKTDAKEKTKTNTKISTLHSASTTNPVPPARVLPARPFNLAALRSMNANVLIDIAELDLNTQVLEPLRPLHTHLQLQNGILSLLDFDARTAQGRMTGEISLDGRQDRALWNAHLAWSGVQLERWIHQTRSVGLPLYLSGEMTGHARLQGNGRSTAEILASLSGEIQTRLRDGHISHLLVEGAGLDLAQGLGVLLKGDDALPVQCGIADVLATDGVLRPRVMVIDTPDSTLWVDGSLSLASEAMDLRAVVMPRDFSPLTLRAPLQVRGSFSQPDVSLDKGMIGLKVGSSFLLGLINPLAALIPLIDPGDAATAQGRGDGCQRLAQLPVTKLGKGSMNGPNNQSDNKPGKKVRAVSQAQSLSY